MTAANDDQHAPGIGAHLLSTRPSQLEIDVPTGLRAVAAPLPARAEGIITDERGDPMVVVDDALTCLNCYHALGWPGTRAQTWLRPPVVDRLIDAQSSLPAGFGLAIFDGWRSPETVRALYDHFYGPSSTLTPGFLADPDSTTLIPPHLTGGAVDLTLTWHGSPLSLGTPFDEFSDRAHLRDLEPDGAEPDRSLRRLLWSTMVDAGFTPFWAEWWHYSWGDADWAADHGEPVAPFGPARPPV